MGMHARLSGAPQAGTRRRAGPSVAVRGKPTVHTDRPGGRTPSAICPWTPRHRDLQRYKVTHGGTRRKRPGYARIRSYRAVSPRRGRCWVRTNEGLADGFTARSLNPRYMPLTCDYALQGTIPGSFRPLCVRGHRTWGQKNPRTGAEIHGRNDGSGYADRPAPFLPSDLRLHDACSSSRRPYQRGRTGLLAATRTGLPGKRRRSYEHEDPPPHTEVRLKCIYALTAGTRAVEFSVRGRTVNGHSQTSPLTPSAGQQSQ
jgi:hypothetical protein